MSKENEQRLKLNQLIKTINNNTKNFYRIGCALREIRDKKLHLESCSNFETFCQIYLGISRTYAYRQIEASKTMDNLLPIGNIQINESQIRPLTKLKPDQQKLAWNYAIDNAKAENRKLTYHDVNNAIKIITGNQNISDATEQTKEFVNIDLASKNFMKAYEIFFDEIKKNLKSRTTDKKIIIKTIKAIIKYVKSYEQ